MECLPYRYNLENVARCFLMSVHDFVSPYALVLLDCDDDDDGDYYGGRVDLHML